MIVVDRKTKIEREYQYGGLVKFLYNNFFGRLLLKLLTNKIFANFGAWFMKSSLSSFMIKKKIKKYNIDMSLYEDREYKSYNDFFTRKLKKIKFDSNEDSFISPCNSKLTILHLNNDSFFNIKGSIYQFKEIINDDIANKFVNGYALIFRLDINDYHHYCYIDNGTRSDFTHIKGKLHTVQPIVYDKVKVFHRNSREWCVLHTENFDDIVMVEVGALLVGRICNNKKIKKFVRGEEKGYFEFGGSTIILFVKDNVVTFDEDILNNSAEGKETIVHCGEKIGQKIKVIK